MTTPGKISKALTSHHSIITSKSIFTFFTGWICYLTFCFGARVLAIWQHWITRILTSLFAKNEQRLYYSKSVVSRKKRKSRPNKAHLFVNYMRIANAHTSSE